MEWATVSALEETFGSTGMLGRETRSEVVLVGRLRSALRRLNPALPAGAIEAAVEELIRNRSAMLPEQANREVYWLLKQGIAVSVSEEESAVPPDLLSEGVVSTEKDQGKGFETGKDNEVDIKPGIISYNCR